MTSLPHLPDRIQHPLADQAEKVKRSLNIINCQVSSQREAFGGDDVMQLAASDAAGFHVPLSDQSFQMPVDSRYRHTQLSRQVCLRGIWIFFNLLQDDEIRIVIR